MPNKEQKQCWGITRYGKRCRNFGDWRFFCGHHWPVHKWPWFREAAILVTFLGVVGSIASIYSVIGSFQSNEPTGLDAEIDLFVMPRESDESIAIADSLLPLAGGDSIQATVKTADDCFVYLVWLDSNGELTPLSPWQDFRWEELGAEEKTKMVRVPKGLVHFELADDQPGLNAIVAVVRRQPFPDSSELKEWLALPEFKQAGLNAIDDSVLLRIVDGEVQSAGTRAGPLTGKTRVAADPVNVLANHLVEQSEKHACSIVAYVFPFGVRAQ